MTDSFFILWCDNDEHFSLAGATTPSSLKMECSQFIRGTCILEKGQTYNLTAEFTPGKWGDDLSVNDLRYVSDPPCCEWFLGMGWSYFGVYLFVYWKGEWLFSKCKLSYFCCVWNSVLRTFLWENYFSVNFLYGHQNKRNFCRWFLEGKLPFFGRNASDSKNTNCFSFLSVIFEILMWFLCRFPECRRNFCVLGTYWPFCQVWKVILFLCLKHRI